jgi:hypothetical protein
MSTSKTQLAHLADRVSLVADDTNGPEIWKFVTDENNSDFDSWVKATHGEVVSGGPLVISEKTTNTQTISGTLYHFNPDGNNPYPIRVRMPSTLAK